jgi:HSP20 family protein
MAHMIVTRRSPRTMFEEMDRVMDSMFDNLPSFSRIGNLATRNPAVDVVEEEDRYLITAELPGMDESRVDIKIDNGILTITSLEQKKAEERTEATTEAPIRTPQEQSKRYLVRERRSSNFSRNFVLPKDVAFDRISATFSYGLLTLELPKEEKALPRKIEIKTN